MLSGVKAASREKAKDLNHVVPYLYWTREHNCVEEETPIL
jgi:phosphoribosylpyrophosphate synthetase